ncbi:hypothetical protein AAMO2058_001251200, partial [Amorphochlora amoebiformis]
AHMRDSVTFIRSHTHLFMMYSIACILLIQKEVRRNGLGNMNINTDTQEHHYKEKQYTTQKGISLVVPFTMTPSTYETRASCLTSRARERAVCPIGSEVVRCQENRESLTKVSGFTLFADSFDVHLTAFNKELCHVEVSLQTGQVQRPMT